MLNLERGSRLTTLIVVLAGMIFAPCAFADDADAFVGTWRLMEHSNWDSDGALVQNFGLNPIGYFVHDRFIVTSTWDIFPLTIVAKSSSMAFARTFPNLPGKL